MKISYSIAKSTEYHEFKDQGHFGGDYFKETFPELVEAIRKQLND